MQLNRPMSPQPRPPSAAAALRQLPPRPSTHLSGELPPHQLSSQHSGKLPSRQPSTQLSAQHSGEMTPHRMSSQLSGQQSSQVPRPALPPLRLPRRSSSHLSGALSLRQMSSQLSSQLSDQLSRLPSTPLSRRASGASDINGGCSSEYGDISAYSSGASTPDGSRPVTPRERVQHQILLNQQKRMQRLQVGRQCMQCNCEKTSWCLSRRLRAAAEYQCTHMSCSLFRSRKLPSASQRWPHVLTSYDCQESIGRMTVTFFYCPSKFGQDRPICRELHPLRPLPAALVTTSPTADAYKLHSDICMRCRQRLRPRWQGSL